MVFQRMGRCDVFRHRRKSAGRISDGSEDGAVARLPKASGRVGSGPWTAHDFDRALKSDGWLVESPGPHTHYHHPDRLGRKVQVDTKWTGVKKGSFTFRGVAAQAGYSGKELQALLNRR
jgi:predicted RNA binding protein YcfA (HicA-like mRNA interferase family)